jgi:N-acetylmuramoyl-L-alanine amidase
MKIGLDAGHGMSNRVSGRYDSGATSGSYEEADIALSWALTGKYILAQKEIATHLIRSNRSEPAPVGSRDNEAQAEKCSHLLSIHCNASNGRASGVEVYYRNQGDLRFAEMVLSSLQEATGLRNRGLKFEFQSQHSRLAVLDFVPPACLMEIGFIDNPKDLEVILRRETRIQFFSLLADRLLRN